MKNKKLGWKDARKKIEKEIILNTHLDQKSEYRNVEKVVNQKINSKSCGYYNESGFIVSIGKSSKIKIPFSMLETCYAALQTSDGYNGKFFREKFPRQAKHHPCHVHTIGCIFVKAGIAKRVGNDYKLSD